MNPTSSTVTPSPLGQAMAAEFANEAAGTRRALERVPEEHFGWKPHAKSLTLGQLASHLADMPSWVLPTLEQEVFDLPEDFQPYVATSRDDLLATFDAHVAAAKEKMAAAGDEDLLATWRLTSGGQVAFEMPRLQVLRWMVLNHAIHHRGQLTVYLRELDIPVPALYGPSADEQG